MKKIFPVITLLFLLFSSPALASHKSNSQSGTLGCDVNHLWRNHGAFVSCIAHLHQGGNFVSVVAHNKIGGNHVDTDNDDDEDDWNDPDHKNCSPSPSPSPTVSPSPSPSPSPEVSPSPSPEVSPSPSVSPEPSVSPSPTAGGLLVSADSTAINRLIASLQHLIEELQNLL